MSKAYLPAIKENLPNAENIIDKLVFFFLDIASGKDV